jgi:hypothetical protein
MATWKKVLVSGSDISVASITSSQIPGGTSDDDVIVLGANGEFKKVTQTSIQGTTVANFTVEDSSGNTDTFNATADTLIFDGDNNASTTISDSGTNTTVTFKLPTGTVSGSSQITLDQTIGYSTFSSSLATDIENNSASFAANEDALNIIDDKIDDLVTTSSNLTEASASIASFITTANTDLTSIETSMDALNLFTSSVVVNEQTSSFLISESVVGTPSEITVTGNGDQGLTIGLPEDVTIGGRLEAGKLVIQGQTVSDGAAAVVEGSTIQGSSTSDIHQFTGSLQITGALEIENGSNNVIFAQTLSTLSSATVDDIIVRTNSDGQLGKIGGAAKAGISGAFDSVSASIALDIDSLDDSATNTNSSDIDDLQLLSSSLEYSASVGIYFSASEGGNSVGLGQSASFVASGEGLTVDIEGTNNAIITYTVDPVSLGGAIGAFSQSAQLQTVLDDIYVNYSEGPISGALQLQNLGFITASTFDNLTGVPTGIISGAGAGTTQGTFTVNDDTVVSVFGLGESDSPTFNNLTITNGITVKGSTTALQTTELNIEDQFLLINSGANGGDVDEEMDGGIIVDTGNGSGAALMYKRSWGAWAFLGSTDPVNNGVNYNELSTDGDPVVPDVAVATVKAEGAVPSDAPAYGLNNYEKGQMHINTLDNSIWIYV